MPAVEVDIPAHAAKLRLPEGGPASPRLDFSGRPVKLVTILGVIVERGDPRVDARVFRERAERQRRYFESHGVAYEIIDVGPLARPDPVIEAVRRCNEDDSVTGVQLCLSDSPDARRSPVMLLDGLDNAKDVLEQKPAKMGWLARNGHHPLPPLALAVLYLIDMGRFRPGRNPGIQPPPHVVVLGRDCRLGGPIAQACPWATTIASVDALGPDDARRAAREADVLVATEGVAQSRWRTFLVNRALYEQGERGVPVPVFPDLSPPVRADWIKPGALVIDATENWIPAVPELAEYDHDPAPTMRAIGDVDAASVAETAGHLVSGRNRLEPLEHYFLLHRLCRRTSPQRPGCWDFSR